MAVRDLSLSHQCRSSSDSNSVQSSNDPNVRPEKITEYANKTGEFKRQQSSFRDFVSSDPSKSPFPPEPGRYHLYVSYACPWAHRTLIARKLKGLEKIIDFTVVHWHMGDKGWRFVTKEEVAAKEVAGVGVEGANVRPDPVPGHEGFTHLRDLYFSVEPEYKGRFTVPVLYDIKQKTIVNNEVPSILSLNTVIGESLFWTFVGVSMNADVRCPVERDPPHVQQRL